MTSARAIVNGRASVPPEVESGELLRLMTHCSEAAARHCIIAGGVLGLNRTEAVVMAVVGTSPPIGLGVLADRFALSRSGISTLVHRLERRGVTRRHTHPRDHRQVLLTATRSYLDPAARLYAPLRAQLDGSIRQLPAATRAEALAWLPSSSRSCTNTPTRCSSSDRVARGR